MSNAIQILDSKGYRKFGLTTGAIIIGLFGLLIPWLFGLNYVKWPWILGGILVLWALLAPGTLKPVYVGWMKFGNVMNWINTRIILGLMFYTVFLFVAILMKLLGKDPMSRKIDKTLDSYRVQSEERARDHLEKPF